jgi:hypothetical protein
MAIKASGTSLSFSEIATFWGGSTPHTLDEYHSGESIVFSGAKDEAGNVIPSSGAISFSDFYSTHTVTTGGTTNFTSSGLYTIPLGVSTLTVTLYGGGGQGGEGDESGAGGGGGGGGGGGVIQGTLTVSNNIQGNPTAQTITVTVGAGGYTGSSRVSGGSSQIAIGGQTTRAGGGGHGGGFNANGTSYGAATGISNSIGSNFSASTNLSASTATGSQGGSGDGFSAAGTAGNVVHNDVLSIGSTGGAGGAINPSSDSVQTGKAASGFGAGGGGAASRDRSGAHHWYGGAGAPGYVRIVVAS